MLDSARVFPPEYPFLGTSAAIFYNKFRPEFVKQNPIALSSDSLTSFQTKSEGAQLYDQHTKEATKHYYDFFLKGMSLSLFEVEFI